MAKANMPDCWHHSELDIERLCVECLKAHCAVIEQIKSDDICSQQIEVKNLAVENEVVNNLCVPEKAQISQAWVDKSYNNSLCASNANIGSACINELNVSKINHCEEWRAAVTFSANMPYVLGSLINWDVVLNDPNSNVSLAPFMYSVPESGYYLLTFHMDHNSLSGAGLISGVPVARLRILSNGSELRSQYSPFLAFSDVQKTSLTSLCLLNKGDKIQMIYDVLVVDASVGLIPYVGSVSILANGGFAGESGFAIHYLSSLNCSMPACPPCPFVEIPCQPVETPCEPINPCLKPGAPVPCPEEPCDCCQ